MSFQRLSFYIAFSILVFTGLLGCKNDSSPLNLDLEIIDSTTKLPLGWGLGKIDNSDIPENGTLQAYILDSVNKKTGKYSLLIDWSKGFSDWTATNYVVNRIFDGKKIKLTGFIRTENVDGRAALWMRLDGENFKNLGFDNMKETPISGTNDWKEYSIELPYNKNKIQKIVVGGLIIGKGKLWIDDLHIFIDGKDIKDLPDYQPVVTEYKALKDTAYNNGSRIQSIRLDSIKVKELTNLGMLWGFLKYYHAHVNKGDFNMDAALFRVLPKIIAAKTSDEANTIMEQWVDGFGLPEKCNDCKDLVKKKQHPRSSCLIMDICSPKTTYPKR